jgi:hypothetical protein
MDHCTVADNVAWDGSAVFMYEQCRLILENTIVALNHGGGCAAICLLGNQSSTFTCNDVWGNTPSNWYPSNPTGTNGNISLDPQLCDLPAGEFTLNAESPCGPKYSVP